MADPIFNPIAGPSPASASMDLHQEFPKLSRDPIVEAVITFACRAQVEWTKDLIADRIQTAFPEYPNSQHINHARVQFNVEFSSKPMPESREVPSPLASTEDLGWMGMRLISADQKQVVTVTRDSLAISRLAPYEGWKKLCDEVLRIWRIHRALASVDSIEQMQTRFINRREVPFLGFAPSDYFAGFGEPPAGMIPGPFLHQDALHFPTLMAYQVNLVRTFDVQAMAIPVPQAIPLIVVLEAMNPEPIPADESMIAARLAEMHSLKNYAFFHSVTRKFLDLCQ